MPARERHYRRTIRLWDASSGAALQALDGNAGISALSFSDDGTLLQTNRGPKVLLLLGISLAGHHLWSLLFKVLLDLLPASLHYS